MGPIGMPELVIIFVIALIIFGPRKLPELGKSLGRSLNEFKRASNELKSTLEDEIRGEDQRTATPAPPKPLRTESRREVEIQFWGWGPETGGGPRTNLLRSGGGVPGCAPDDKRG